MHGCVPRTAHRIARRERAGGAADRTLEKALVGPYGGEVHAAPGHLAELNAEPSGVERAGGSGRHGAQH